MRSMALGWTPVLAAVLSLSAGRAWAVTPLLQLRFSTDITTSLDTSTLNDEDVGIDNLAGTVSLQSIGSIPAETDLDGYAVRPNGNQLLSFDTAVVLPGGLTAGPADVVRYDGATYSMEFNGAARGVPNGVNIDAVAIYGSSLLLSFDVAVDLGALHAEREDLVLFDGAGFTMFFDGSAAGVSPDLNLDAASYLDCDDHLLLSFDGSGTIGGVAFDDEDVLEYNRAGTWELAYDGSARHPGWSAADLDDAHAVVDLGPGPAAVFGQTIASDADKSTLRWPSAVPFRSVKGAFATSANIGAYTVTVASTGAGSSYFDPATPAAGTGFWYLVRRWGCAQYSWQSTLGAEPGRDSALP